MMNKIVIVFLFIFGFFFTGNNLYAFNCLSLTASSTEAEKNYCRQELAQIEAQLAELLGKQNEQKKQTGTLQGDVNYLNSEINALRKKIQARSLAISQIKVSINEKSSKIVSLEERIEKEHRTLAQLIRNTNEFDNENLIHLILSDDTLTDFYSNIESYSSLKQAIKKAVDEVRGIKSQTETEKDALEKKRNAEVDAQVELENARKKVSQSEAEKKKLLEISKNKESEYQKLAAQKKAEADRIRSALFPVLDTDTQINFGDALRYAQQAQSKTNVRAALVLAVLKQESNLGANTGRCVVVDLTTGQTRGVNSGTVFNNGIHPTRDLPLLQTIVRELGRSASDTRISCPIVRNGEQIGFGGAMGPAQFIPSTWNMIKSGLATALGKAVPNPWNPQDAIMAASFLLRDNGAGAGGYTAERNAACRYYSGSVCPASATSTRARDIINYGNNIMALVNQMQRDIDLLSN
jgi:peptidoglycan hydrolase CwlO-like protein